MRNLNPIALSARKYIQSKNAMTSLGQEASAFGSKVLVVHTSAASRKVLNLFIMNTTIWNGIMEEAYGAYRTEAYR